MSLAAMTWAWNLRGLAPARKLVLLALADWANDSGRSWHCSAEIAERAECSIDTVRRAIGELCEAGIVYKTKRHRDDGASLANEYVLLCNAEALEYAVAQGYAAGEEIKTAEGGGGEDSSVDDGSAPDEGGGRVANCGGDPSKLRGGPLHSSAGGTPATVLPPNIDKPKYNPKDSPPSPPRGAGRASFSSIKEIWPFDPGDLPEGARKAFERLSEDDREAAVKGAPVYLAWIEQKGGKRLSCENWLRRRGWEVAVASPPRAVLPQVWIVFGTAQYFAWLDYWKLHDPSKVVRVGGPERLTCFESRNPAWKGRGRPEASEWPPRATPPPG